MADQDARRRGVCFSRLVVGLPKSLETERDLRGLCWMLAE